jgi:hypothetical protein
VTADEASALKADLERAGVYVHAAKPRIARGCYAGTDDWQLYCWCEDPPHFYTITDAARFRQAVHDGLSDVLPRGALDFGPLE